MLTLSAIVSLLYQFCVIFVLFASKTAKAIPLDVVTCYRVENVNTRGHFEENIPVKQRLTLKTLQDGHNDCKADSDSSPY